MKQKGLRGKVETTRTKSYVADLNVHTPAALGGMMVQLDAAPAIVRLAKVKGLDMIAVTDFYGASSIDRVAAAADASSIGVIPGFSFRCIVGQCDDVIMTALFAEGTGTAGVQGVLDALHVPSDARGNPKFILEQSLEEIISLVESRGGIVIPCRVDKTPLRMSIIPLLVEQYGFRIFDLAYAESSKMFKQRWPKLKFQLVGFSSATALAQIGNRASTLKLTEPGFAGVRSLATRALSEAN